MDRRVQKTREAIRTSYFQLLQQKQNGRITVAELTRHANIDRKTFYLHYNCIEDILDQFCDEKVEELLGRLNEKDFCRQPFRIQIIFEALNEILEENIEYYRVLSLQNYQSFWEKIHQIMVQALIRFYSDRVTVSKEVMKYYCDFIVSGMIRLYQDYLKNPAELSVSQMETVILDIATNGIINLLKKE